MKYENLKTEEDFKEYFAKFFSPEQVRDNLTIAGLYLAAFEVLKAVLIGNVRSFYAFNFPYKGEWDPEKIQSKEYLQAIERFYPLSKGKKVADQYVACARWFENSNAVSAKDVETIINIRKERNKVAHELPELLLDPKKTFDFDLLIELGRLIKQIDRWWVIEVEIPTNPPGFFENKEIDYDGVMSGRMIYMDHIFNMVFKEEFEAYRKSKPAETHK